MDRLTSITEVAKSVLDDRVIETPASRTFKFMQSERSTSELIALTNGCVEHEWTSSYWLCATRGLPVSAHEQNGG